jgi:hypothetical protein
MIKILIDLERSGDLRRLIKAGLMSPAVLKYYNIYLEVDKYKQTTSMKMTDIISKVSEDFAISERTVYLSYEKIRTAHD